MTNEERVEEILIKSHNLGIRKEVINSAVALMDVDKTISFYDAIDNAYRIEKNKLIENLEHLKSKMRNEGFHYCFKHYSTFKEIDDVKFHELRIKYLRSADDLENYINSSYEELIHKEEK